MKIVLNGESIQAERGESVGSLLGRLGIDPKRVAVERNLEILPKSRYAETLLADGDRIEVVQFVGGG